MLETMSPSPASVSGMRSGPSMVRCNSSYTSLVYQEKESLSGPNLATMIQSLVEWLIILQRLEEERRSDMPPVSCRCVKAATINDELKTVARGLTEASRLSERVASEAVNPQLEAVYRDLVRLAGLLRADVSILIPGNIGRAEPGVAEQARSVLAEVEGGGVPGLVAETVESVTRLVYSLLGVTTCTHCSGTNETEAMEDQEIDPDIMNMVAAMCGDYSGLPNKENEERTKSNQGVGRQVLERSRKRKQNRPSKFQPTPLPLHTKIANNSTGLGSPTKKVRKVGECGDGEKSQTEILFLLEKKKKLVKKDGLYKFVLWREALREEKNKVCL